MEERIRKYWQGELTKEEISTLLSDLACQENALSEENLQAFEAIASKEAEKSREHVLEALHQRIEQDRMEAGGRTNIRVLSFLKIAAAVGVIFFGIHLLWNSYTPTTHDAVATPGLVDIVKENDSEEEMVLHLPDRSMVTLYPGSRVRWVVEGEEQHRVVHLSGKAQFDVAKDVDRPFSVVNNGYSTTALGTSFIVDDGGGVSSSVTLLSGKVVVKAENNTPYAIGEVYLNPGERLDIDIINRDFAVRESIEVGGQRLYTEESTKTQRMSEGVVPTAVSLNFDREDLSSVFEAIASFAGIEVSLENVDIDGVTFTGDLGGMKTAERMLQMVCNANQLQYKYENNHYIIISKD